ncbi:Nucleoside diphosphate kinase 7 [Chionoecetes opilio]|uniref:Nucleoside diphosphate kinase 7 n=1 Tax=Chionoecetes opilio TaxID=41210 RepID=A0A8J5CLI7_CHIOP|nr:Nucleoside diphosphate kinase 7 [Chionoecetes opilio]
MVQQLMAGPLVAVEVTSSIHGAQTPVKFRELVGPSDPEVARELRPNSLRARFGEDIVKNGVHCSDLPDDGPLELLNLADPAVIQLGPAIQCVTPIPITPMHMS